jgi:hypothetical protein
MNTIIHGQARLDGDQLRCSNPRQDWPDRECRKLLAKTNRKGQISGNFMCERCHSVSEVSQQQQ